LIFLLGAHRDAKAARRFFKRAIKNNGMPTTITIDGSHYNKDAIESINKDLEA
jgi:putative transposase